jgi:hypothetical protein
MGFRVGERLADDLARDAAAFESGRHFGVINTHDAVDELIVRNAQATFHLRVEATRFGVVAHLDDSVGGVL